MPNPFQLAAEGDATPADLAGEIMARPQDAAEVYHKAKSRGMAQVVFRLALLSVDRHECGFCGLSLSAAPQAAHIIPWGRATPEQRVSPGQRAAAALPLTMRYSTRGFSASQLLARSPADGTRCRATDGPPRTSTPQPSSTENP